MGVRDEAHLNCNYSNGFMPVEMGGKDFIGGRWDGSRACPKMVNCEQIGKEIWEVHPWANQNHVTGVDNLDP